MKKFAIYLPQFHRCKENDQFWGEGFTDWVTTKAAKKIYFDHDQPMIPKNGYYDLSNKEEIISQAKLARDSGINGFAIYHYRFDQETKALYEPLEIIINNPEIDIEFYLSWVNTDWTKSWVGDDKTTIFKQKYNTQFYEHFFAETIKAFHDARYLKIDNKPVFHIHHPENFDIQPFIEMGNAMAIKAGFSGITWTAPLIYVSKSQESYFDFLEGYPPGDLKFYNISRIPLLNRLFRYIIPNFFIKSFLYRLLNTFTFKNYSTKYKTYLNSIHNNYKNYIPCILTNWDNTPRYANRGYVLRNPYPHLFHDLLRFSINLFKDQNPPFVIIKAWNEWAEGNFLEPDKNFASERLEGLLEIE